MMVNKEMSDLRRAYVLARKLSGARLTIWWDHYIQAFDYYKEHGSYENINQAFSWWGTWAGAVRKSKQKGHLSSEQIVALKKIDFPFQPIKGGSKPGTGPKLDEIFKLKAAEDAGEKLNTNQQRLLRAAIAAYTIVYKAGNLSEVTAETLGISIKPPL